MKAGRFMTVCWLTDVCCQVWCAARFLFRPMYHMSLHRPATYVCNMNVSLNVPFSIYCFQNKCCYPILTADENFLIGVCSESTQPIVSCRVTRHHHWAAFGLCKPSLTTIAFYSDNRIQKDRSLRITIPRSQDNFGARRFLVPSNSPVITVRSMVPFLQIPGSHYVAK